MKKLLFILIAIFGFCSISFAQEECYPTVSINDDNCDYSGVISYANIRIQIYNNSNCSGEPCYKNFMHLPYPLERNEFDISSGLTCSGQNIDCTEYVTIKVIATLYNSNGNLVCSGSTDCENWNVSVHTVFVY